MKKCITVIVFFLNLNFFNYLTAEEIPTIIISAGKTPQSLSTVGSTVEVITSEDIENSTHNNIGNIIDEYSTSTNLFQMGGAGGNIGIQLRGLEKRYSTVYIDGVKMLDPSSSDGSFYLENVMKTGIERVEVLKGTQSSLYGSNAIGGTINIFTKKGKEGNNSDFEIETGSKDTRNISYSVDGDDGKINYFIGGNKLISEGFSTMNDNDEQDAYRNNNIVGNLGYKINENLRFQNSFRLANSYFEYDEVAAATNDKDTSTANLEGSLSLKLIQEKNKFKNTISYNKLHIERETTSDSSSKSNYYGYRDALNFLGEYNFNLDNKIVYGIDTEFDAARYYKGSANFGTADQHHDESIISQYFDYQFRPFEQLYSTIGFRSDDHTTAGRKTSGRGTVAYLLDGNSKIRSSLGSGVRFPALYDYKFGGTTVVDYGGTLETLKSERGNSFDLGYDTYLNNLDLGLSMTYFKSEQKNSLKSDARTGWVVANNTGVNTSEGLEIGGKWKPVNQKYSLGFGYTLTDTFDANTCDPREKESSADSECRHNGSAVDTAKVRVPRHAVQAKIDYSFYPNLKSSLQGRYMSETRDFGNSNDGWTDQILTDYFVYDFASSYKLFNGYNFNISINNILDEKYQQAHQYTAPGRTLTFGLKRAY